MGKACFERGGIAIARQIREEYFKNPKLCRECDGPILPKEGEKLSHAKKKLFCSKSCSATHNNKKGLLGRQTRIVRPCAECGENTNTRDHSVIRKLCEPCWTSRSSDHVKKQDSTHAKIRGHARHRTALEGASCALCPYDLHVEVCHIRPVSDFPATATLREMNAPDNLVLLCRNHHWEFDNGLITVDQIRQAQ
jgi:hypothetical protein